MEMSLQVHSLEKIEYRSAIRFCVLLSQTNQEIMANLDRAYGEKCPSQSTIKFWIAEFKRGRQSVSDEEREGRPTTSRNEDVKEKLEKMVLEAGVYGMEKAGRRKRLAVNRIFDQLPPSFYHGAFEALPGRWQKCVDAGGNWFEK